MKRYSFFKHPISHTVICTIILAGSLSAAEFHVAVNGADANPGTGDQPLKTIQAAADKAQPGDTVTVHAGIYRERINPPRGGLSDTQRITYRAAPGEKVEIRGSERVKGWTNVAGDVWKVVIPNTFFGRFNPYSDLIKGDWFDALGRQHHTGAVYLAGDWLKEAAKLDEVLVGQATPTGTNLFNVMSFKPQKVKDSISATAGTVQGLVRKADTPAGACLGFIQAGSSATFTEVDFGSASTDIEFKVSSIMSGAIIQVLLDDGSKAPIGQHRVVNSGGWEQWQTVRMSIPSTSGRHGVILQFLPPRVDPSWFSQVDAENTTIHAQFKGADPNREPVEINVRQSVFYPDQPGRNYITVRGFTMRNAATPWAPPTAEQIGLIGTHWSKGWIIEDNTISHSICSGITLGKHGDSFDNTSANSAGGYVKTVERAHAFTIPWDKEHIGSHVVRNNHVSHCEQTGICGSLGAIFSTITGNTIHDIHARRLFTGCEQAGIKIHAAIDTEISGNRIYRAFRGMWMDWMAQGTRMTGNLCYENDSEDLYMEVNHGPYLVDNNIFLSNCGVWDMSEGGAFVHNLITGRIKNWYDMGRLTPFMKPHTAEIGGLVITQGGDNRFYNNVFMGRGASTEAVAQDMPQTASAQVHGLWTYDGRPFSPQTGGNWYGNGARPHRTETSATMMRQDGLVTLETKGDQVVLNLDYDQNAQSVPTTLVTTALLGQTRVAACEYKNPDGTPVRIATDYFGKPRSTTKPTPGPFETRGASQLTVWPLTSPKRPR